MAKEVLIQNCMNRYVFAETVRNLLQQERSQNRNLFIAGPAKTFISIPLTKIYKTFQNPSSNKYAFVGVKGKDII